VGVMPSKTFKASEWDLNINLFIKILAIDFLIGLINTVSITNYYVIEYIKVSFENTLGR
jgi:hypothetical protein